MVRLVKFDKPVEELVGFIEHTHHSVIVDRVVERIREGTDPNDLVRAASLAVTRSSELPNDHHGGPLHPVAGVHAIRSIMRRLHGQDRMLAAVQCVALACKHIHLPSMGPAAMIEFDDLDPCVDSVTALRRLENALANRQPRLAERAIIQASRTASPGEILSRLLKLALPRNSLDDHYFLYPVYAMRALDAIGWQWAPYILRPVVRYVCRHHSFDGYGEFADADINDGIHYYKRFGEFDDLISRLGLNEDTVPMATGPHEDAAIAEMADAVGEVDVIASLPETIARALSRGLSLQGTCEALSIGGARLFLRSHSSNPFDVHIHTGISARRYLIGFDEIDFRTKCIALLGWPWSYEVRYLDHTLKWEWQHAPETAASASPEHLLQQIRENICQIDGYDMRNLPDIINNLVAGPGVQDIVRLAETYVRSGHDPEALFSMTAGLVCRDDASEMHAYKLQQAAYEEYAACREPHKWVHAVSAVKQCAVAVSMKPQRFYPQFLEKLAA